MLLEIVISNMDFYLPKKKFGCISVTGTGCVLDCLHCRGRYLKGMDEAKSPHELYVKAHTMACKGYTGFLLSGGCDAQGRVPLDDFLSTISRIKEETSLIINVHTGMIESAEELGTTGVDVVSYEMIGNRETISGVYRLDKGPEDILRGYDELRGHGLRVVPHVTVGMYNGIISGEYHALDMLKGTDALVINSLIPSREYGSRVRTESILSVLEYARENIGCRVVMGCMRERGRHDLEIGALESGVSGMVMPGKRAVDWALEHDHVEWYEGCCAVYL